MEDCGVICVSLKVLDVAKFENHCPNMSPKC